LTIAQNGAETACDLAVVGAGIIGLACARELAQRHPGWKIVVLDKEPGIGAHQTAHNSGVIHAGIYYAPGSLKAELCVRGARRLYDFCDEHGIPARRSGKLIVAADESELDGLRKLMDRGQRNGVPGLRWLDGAALRELEPHAAGVAALHSPQTGVVDFRAVAAQYAADLRDAGHEIVQSCAVSGVKVNGRGLQLDHAQGTLPTRYALFCAGAWSDRLAEIAGASRDPRIIPFRGAYMQLKPERRHLVNRLIYPVPDATLPFLGVHLSRHIDDTVTLGPTALMAPGRDAYRLTQVNLRDSARTLTWPGTSRLAWRFRRAAAVELRHAMSRKALVAAAARYVPELTVDDVVPGGAGVRAQAVARDGTLVDDFAFSHTERALHVRNAPSPAATSSLAIAEHVADVFDKRFADA
jgi:2-hydroxyglutarate dehydrogenase